MRCFLAQKSIFAKRFIPACQPFGQKAYSNLPMPSKFFPYKKDFSRFCALLLTFFCLFAVKITAQTGEDETLRVETNLVRLNVGVVDGKGNPLTNLTKNDFTVYEDGVKQTVSRFEPANAPFSIVLLLDSSGSTLALRQIITQSAIRFLDALAPNDRVAVVTFNDKVEVLSNFTTDRRATIFAVNLVGNPKIKGKTQFYKAVESSLDKLALEKTSRKAIVALTDGVDTSLKDLDRALVVNADTNEKAIAAIKSADSPMLNKILLRADKQGVTVYPLALPSGDPKKLADPTPAQVAMFTAARERLGILATRTGGSINFISRLEDMGRLYAAVAAEVRTLYSIEYESSNETSKNNFRQIKIELSKPEFIVKTRPGYFVK